MNLTSTLTCPQCGHSATETMPENACMYFYECLGCGALLKPRPGDCCVYCSYADMSCPPMQEARLRGADGTCCGSASPMDRPL